MSKCFSRWQGRIVRPTGKPMYWEIECGTCKLKLENGKAVTSCGLRAFYSRRAAVRMGSLSSMIWDKKMELANALQQKKDFNPCSTMAEHYTYQTLLNQIDFSRKAIIMLMLEKRNPMQYAELVKWDEMLKQNSKNS